MRPVLDSYNPLTGGYNQTLNPTHFQTEFNAFRAGAEVNHEHGFGPTVPQVQVATRVATQRQQRRFCEDIPEDTHVLVTHGPPLGILDAALGERQSSGHPELLKAVRRVVPRIHAFGHIHSAYGIVEWGGTTFVNAALLDAHGGIGHPPIVLRMTRK